MGAGLSRSVSVRFLVYLVLFPERHARLPHRAFVRNGVVMRVEQNYDHQTYEDLYGNRGTFAHNPRMCLKGYTFHRRVYGPYRLKGPLMRKGLEGVDGRRLPRADARDEAEIQVR
jgi:hypothetical protein